MSNVSLKNTPDADDGSAATELEHDSQTGRIEEKVNRFLARHGRRPRVLVSAIGLGGRRRDLNQAAALFARWGFDVDIGPACQLPRQVALMAIENDVHMICLLGDHTRQLPSGSELPAILQALGSGDILVAHFGDEPLTIPNRRTVPARIRPATAAADIVSALEKLTQKN